MYSTIKPAIDSNIWTPAAPAPAGAFFCLPAASTPKPAENSLARGARRDCWTVGQARAWQLSPSQRDPMNAHSRSHAVKDETATIGKRDSSDSNDTPPPSCSDHPSTG